MPELPEVETVRRSLQPRVQDRSVDLVTVLEDQIIEGPVKRFRRQLTGSRITGLERRGKYLLWVLADGSLMVNHLRMTGRLLWNEAASDSPGDGKHLHLVLSLDSGDRIFYHDVRKFGRFYYLPVSSLDDCALDQIRGERFGTYAPKGLKTLGPEPISPAFGPEYLKTVFAHRTASIKSLLLNQQIVAGLGNIYADESLFDAGIDPATPAAALDTDSLSRLCSSTGRVVQTAIEHCGTTLRDFRDLFGLRGQHAAHLKVYGREGEPCKQCKTSIQRTRLSGRSTYFCPDCQPGRDDLKEP